ncbi:CRISP/Allergen/PR-1-like [Stegodyphus dumicola]|uniref:CRISP/Allergen/PR-1-like n=1 Tax=Stegodyphus dumicola TaxID=202533 RepID=UPI0015AC6F9C|nr:CRISP/Allergen/PR-1-like [Stegodyphus dumicola]
MVNHVIRIALLFVLLLELSECAKCPYAKFTPNHSFCKDPNPKCTILERGLKPDDKKRLLDLHNMYREKVASGKETQAGKLPSATNMFEMAWDDELASIAQKWAEQCIYDHDCDECRQVDRFDVGQNLYRAGNSDKPTTHDWDKMVKKWYDEVSIFDKSYIKPFFSGDYNHFTQIVWATTWKLGCGFVVYKEPEWYRSYLVCNYGPAGNWDEEEMYNAGRTCSYCPAGSCCGADCTKKYKKTSKYPSLCMVVNPK